MQKSDWGWGRLRWVGTGWALEGTDWFPIWLRHLVASAFHLLIIGLGQFI